MRSEDVGARAARQPSAAERARRVGPLDQRSALAALALLRRVAIAGAADAQRDLVQVARTAASVLACGRRDLLAAHARLDRPDRVDEGGLEHPDVEIDGVDR